MTDILLSAHMMPFTLALGLVFGLLLLELTAALMGGSLMGADTDADLDLDVDADLDVDLDPDLEADVDTLDTNPGALAWLGIGRVPFMIWLATLLMSFGLIGLTLQSILMQSLGFALPAGLAALVVAPAGLWTTRQFSGAVARLLPKTESSAISKNHLGRRRGIISQGTAARGKPAEVRVLDRHGNTHYLRAEPLRDDQVFAQGTEVLVMRKSLNEGYRLVALSE